MNVQVKMAALCKDLDVQIPSIGADLVNLAWQTFQQQSQPQSQIIVEAISTDMGKRDIIQMATRLARYVRLRQR